MLHSKTILRCYKLQSRYVFADTAKLARRAAQHHCAARHRNATSRHATPHWCRENKNKKWTISSLLLLCICIRTTELGAQLFKFVRTSDVRVSSAHIYVESCFCAWWWRWRSRSSPFSVAMESHGGGGGGVAYYNPQLRDLHADQSLLLHEHVRGRNWPETIKPHDEGTTTTATRTTGGGGGDSHHHRRRRLAGGGADDDGGGNVPVNGINRNLGMGTKRKMHSGRWRSLRALTFAKLAVAEFVATYLFSVWAIGATVASAMARDHLAEVRKRWHCRRLCRWWCYCCCCCC